MRPGAHGAEPALSKVLITPPAHTQRMPAATRCSTSTAQPTSLNHRRMSTATRLLYIKSPTTNLKHRRMPAARRAGRWTSSRPNTPHSDPHQSITSTIGTCMQLAGQAAGPSARPGTQHSGRDHKPRPQAHTCSAPGRPPAQRSTRYSGVVPPAARAWSPASRLPSCSPRQLPAGWLHGSCQGIWN